MMFTFHVASAVAKQFLICLLCIGCLSILASAIRPRLAQTDDCPVVLGPQPPLGSERIIGGDPSGMSLASSLVYLVNSSDYFRTGILVAPDVIVFYAYCCVDLNASVYVGYQSDPGSGKRYSISTINIHPLYDGSSLEYDFAYAVLSEPVSGNAAPVKINTNTDYPLEGSFVRHVGYGRTDSDESPEVIILNQVDVPVQDEDSCIEQYGYYETAIFQGKLFCSGYGDRICNKCYGDGPLIQYDDTDHPVLVGLWGAGDCGEDPALDLEIRIANLESFLPDSVERTSDVVQVRSSEIETPSSEIGPPSQSAIATTQMTVAPSPEMFTASPSNLPASSSQSAIATTQMTVAPSPEMFTASPSNLPASSSRPSVSSSFSPSSIPVSFSSPSLPVSSSPSSTPDDGTVPLWGIIGGIIGGSIFIILVVVIILLFVSRRN